MGGADVVYLGAGNDTIFSGPGFDRVWGGAGADRFDVYRKAGWNRIEDFSLAEGDTIALAQGMWFASAGVLTEEEVISRFGSVNPKGDVTLTFGAAGTSVALIGHWTLDGLADHIILL